jgi:hypothetical protein
MVYFSKQIKHFLTSLALDGDKEVSIVPKSDSCADPGDFVIFRYKLGRGFDSRRERVVLVVQPIVKEAGTGNLLLTGFRVPDFGGYTPASVYDLYENRKLPKENYRTYILGNIWGPLRRVKKKLRTPEDKSTSSKLPNQKEQ